MTHSTQQTSTGAEKEVKKKRLFEKIIAGGRSVRREVLAAHRGAIAQALDKKDFLIDLTKEWKVALEVRSMATVKKQPAIDALKGLIGALQEQSATYRTTAQSVHRLGDTEMIAKTNSGQKLLQAADNAATQIAECGRRIAAASEIVKLYEDIPGNGNVIVRIEEYNLRLARFFVLNLSFAQQFGQRIDELLGTAVEVIQYEAVKAWVLENPDEAHEALEVALEVFDNGIAATARAGDVLSNVPDYHTQAAATGIKWSMVASTAGKAVVDRMLKSASVDRQITNFNQENGPGEIYGKLDERPDLIATMLSNKAQAEIELILALVEPIVSVGTAWIPYAPVDKIWGALKELVLAAVKQYQQERLDLANGRGKQSFEVFKQFHVHLLKNMKDKIRGDVTGVVDIVNWSTEVVRETLVNDMLKVIMGALPVDPAQLVDGAALRSMINDVIAAAQLRRSILVVAPGADAPPPRPKRDSLQRRVFLLSGPIGQDDDLHYFARLSGGTVGRIHVKNARFVEAPAGDEEADRYRGAPLQDSTGTTLDEINLTYSHPASGDPDTKVYRARVKDLIGEFDPATRQFTPTGPDQEYLDEAAWRQRSIDVKRGGYWKLSEGKRGNDSRALVKGQWYRPWPEHRKFLYAFVHESGLREFAIGLWLTGDPEANIEDSVGEVAVDRELTTL